MVCQMVINAKRINQKKKKARKNTGNAGIRGYY